MGSGRLPLNLVYVEDAVDALLLAATKPDVSGRVFQLVDPATLTQREYIEAAKKHGSAPQVSYVPKPVLYVLALGVELLARAYRWCPAQLVGGCRAAPMAKWAQATVDYSAKRHVACKHHAANA